MKLNILTRDERRAMQRAKEKHVFNLMKSGYSEWTDITDLPHTKSVMEGLTIVPKKVYQNGIFTVQVYDTPNDWNAERVMIRWHDARSDHDWGLFQRIKNDLFGVDRVALEVYPSEVNKQNVANMYWLWVLPKGFNCPIEIKR